MSILGFIVMAASSASSCTPMPGAGEIADQTRTKWIILGEMHGTAEMPVAMTDFICSAATKRRPLAVAVEQTVDNQLSIDTFIHSNGNAPSRAAFAKAPMWRTKGKDGRSSVATFDMFDRLRIFYRANKIARVVAIDPIVSNGSADRNAQMAKNLLAIEPKVNGLVLALMGGLHAQKTDIIVPSGRWPSTASLLPKDYTVTLMMVGGAGSAWVCFETCGPQPIGEPRDKPRGVEVQPVTADFPFDGFLEIGSGTSASPPWNNAK
ncbi:hypothetical protein C8J46_108153 [Sphingomonas sp. PP-F2F-A104-K0414]|uniref:hypothetical protein n=1 Tax=Sphingomonas sp. PP-F2F-A104-K0414 TaxID=2135661 RepID=UPI00104E6E40|nr:hypothetical protein [Sphingomonas sp. PP-F2F-A104-K0414]TCP96775.1 hypothetical protein C8J46_108153 [Sphingomonas sp. PP-F2F-A104-K0414]